MQKRVNVNVLGVDLTLITEDSKEHILTIADFVERELMNLKSEYPQILPNQLFIMMALNIADKYFKVKDERNELLRSLKSPEYALSDLRKEIADIKSEHEKTKSIYEKAFYKIIKTLEEAESSISEGDEYRKWLEKIAFRMRDKKKSESDIQLKLDEKLL